MANTMIRTTSITVPIHSSFDIYPTSPITSFPPPAPVNSRSLKERCGYSLSITTSSPHGAKAAMKVLSPKMHGPHRSNLPRRRKPKKCFQNFNPGEDDPILDAKPKVAEPEEPKPDPALQPDIPTEPQSYLQELIPGLSIAFATGNIDEPLPQSNSDKPYSHVVNITYSVEEDGSDASTSKQTYYNRAQRLNLVLPGNAKTCSGRAGLGLTDAHLRVVRDFLAEALPRELAEQSIYSSVRILITTPHGRPTDAMCIVGCYLSFLSGKDTETVLRYVDQEEDFYSVWKGEVSEDELARVEKVARAWSWLSQVPLRRGRT